MVYVRLAKDWTDPSGNAHSAGDMVDVDAATLAKLEADGVVAESSPDAGWVGPSGGGSTDAGWVGPSGGGSTDAGWVGPSGGGKS